jgi:hypothetical protein
MLLGAAPMKNNAERNERKDMMMMMFAFLFNLFTYAANLF